MGRRITTIVAGVAVMALVVAAIVALTTQTGQAAAAPDKAATAGATAQDCPTGQDCGGCAAQGAGAATQQTEDGAAQDCNGCGARAAPPGRRADHRSGWQRGLLPVLTPAAAPRERRADSPNRRHAAEAARSRAPCSSAAGFTAIPEASSAVAVRFTAACLSR